MEEKVIDRFYHEHPLILVDTVSEKESGLDCYGCGNLVPESEPAYVCTVQNCTNRIILHKKCGELPSQILHPKHPKHPIDLVDYRNLIGLYWCDICLCDINTTLGYQCASCHFDVDVTCPIISIDSIIEGKMELNHKSHPQHPLTLMTKSSSFSFYCDGCGAQEVDMAYTCRICEIWIHKSCALLPEVIDEKSCHHHKLTLEFIIPAAHRIYILECDVCNKRLRKTCWAYFCGDCRFFAHVRCVAFPKTESTNLNLDDDDVIMFPLHARDISEKLISPFVERVGPTPPDDSGEFEKLINWFSTTAGLKDKSTLDMPQSFSFLFDRHKHRLRLVSESSNKMMDEEGDEDELKICDVCVTPISSPPYYECGEACKHFVHSSCCLLPKTFSPSSSTSNLYGECINSSKPHRFKLYTTSKFDMDTCLCKCAICGLITNGRVYQCEECKMMIDVKCASLPNKIRHASHPHHICGVKHASNKCQCCGYYLKTPAYCCIQDCGFALHFGCAMLPKSISTREWDRHHPLILLFDAGHHSTFICDNCEEELNMRTWMYYCGQCDVSFHTHCLKAVSGEFRNIKFGRQFVLNGIHPDHPLTFNCVTIKKKCDLCHKIVYNNCGFECGSCYFVVCLHCGRKELANKIGLIE